MKVASLAGEVRLGLRPGSEMFFEEGGGQCERCASGTWQRTRTSGPRRARGLEGDGVQRRRVRSWHRGAVGEGEPGTAVSAVAVEDEGGRVGVRWPGRPRVEVRPPEIVDDGARMGRPAGASVRRGRARGRRRGRCRRGRCGEESMAGAAGDDGARVARTALEPAGDAERRSARRWSGVARAGCRWRRSIGGRRRRCPGWRCDGADAVEPEGRRCRRRRGGAGLRERGRPTQV